ncbi:N-acetylglucosaminylphosphatidylinositol deacetylase, putative [Eimeria maxima]|uniref:N-acetylglucosaminylphosphatidylinositol deacetylase n=1 Tax=Eimeria maxima TaxID=5804 RepID=U6M2Z0_EIMMA|nr:N-acetylglucosaminylphosphatidylinositol deacetylase, putative [Eimeria maxima]CDJ56814.1 N-acetylglucosaminylphosphatidylinositol deacetylase, putative [Eimeria maxima]
MAAAANITKLGAVEEMATAASTDTSPAPAAVPPGDPRRRSSSGDSNSGSSSGSSSTNGSNGGSGDGSSSGSSSVRSSSNTNYGVALGAVGAALTVTLLQYLPRLFSYEGRAAFRAALVDVGGSDWLVVSCCTLFCCGCIGSILYNARLAHNWRLERFIVALVNQQRRQQQLLLQQLQKEGHEQHPGPSEEASDPKKQHEDCNEEKCCCDEREEQAKIGVLFVTAHPDDECMFFAPSLSLFASKKERFEVFLLCLSTGDYAGLGTTRKAELFAAAAAFGILKENVCCVDEGDMKDGWNKWSSKSIFTFDCRGVSSHPNHVSVYEGLKLLNAGVIETCRLKNEQQQKMRMGELGLLTDAGERPDEDPLQVTDGEQQQELRMLPSVFIFSLQTHGLLRKYCGVLNLIPATVEANNKGVCVAVAVAAASTAVVAVHIAAHPQSCFVVIPFEMAAATALHPGGVD